VIAIPTLVSANTSNSATISIGVVVPERAENQRCTIGFENSYNDHFTPLQNTGCLYNSNALLQTAYQQASKNSHATHTNSQGFVTVVVTAP